LPARFVLFDDPFNPDGRRLASAGGTRKNEKEPGEVKLWDLTTGQDVYTLGSHASVIYGVAYSPCGRSLATASEDGTIGEQNRPPNAPRFPPPGELDNRSLFLGATL